jgi:hypothetical protein
MIDVACSETTHHIHNSNCTIVWHNDTQAYDKPPTCFGVFRLSIRSAFIHGDINKQRRHWDIALEKNMISTVDNKRDRTYAQCYCLF